MLTQIYNGHILTPEGWVNQGSVVFSDGHITEVTKSSHIIERADRTINAHGMHVVP
ncbi:MAG TPA: N-acetylglucosamine-6-phosphate deacetylase, partial [Porphyromonadaceae bacterium]|nr:N-acetylglucosamine-6-phosphate deacetylase [Porphyromonadaceae bacterium]